ncbi:MAG: hypothetical protein IKK94_06275 [Clostridia bacterium]|nr:hypothetical protein [Clostridia bacterium]
MIYKNIEIWGADNVKDAKGGACPQKMPDEVADSLSSWAPAHSRRNIGMELRFVPISGEAKLTLSTKNEGDINKLYLFFGTQQSPTVLTVTYEPQTFTIALPERIEYLEKMAKEKGLAFSPRVVRLMMSASPVVIHSIEGDLRPPKAEETPALRGIFYGSSITQGSHGIIPPIFWNRRTANKLGVDCKNYGFAGCCLVEKAAADYFAALDDWDFMVLELGINLVGKIEPDEFRERVRYTLSTIHEKHPDKYLFCIDIFHYGSDNGDYHVKVDAFRQVVIEEAARLASPYIKIFGGETILPDDLGLSTDMVHPGIEGMIEMADNLSRLMRPYIEKYKKFSQS